MNELYIDNPLSLDWEQGELLDELEQDKVYKITTRHTVGKTCYDLSAVGTYSMNVLVDVKDIEVDWEFGADEI